jgi:hypothetical protein
MIRDYTHSGDLGIWGNILVAEYIVKNNNKSFSESGILGLTSIYTFRL